MVFARRTVETQHAASLRCCLGVQMLFVRRRGLLLTRGLVAGSACDAIHVNTVFDKEIALNRRGQLLKFLDARKFVYIFEAEAQQKILRGFVQNGAPDYLFSSSSRNELARDQVSEHSAAVDSANFADLRCRDWLLVSNHGQRFQCLQREADRWLQALGKGSHYVVMLRFGRHPVAARNLPDFHSVLP